MSKWFAGMFAKLFSNTAERLASTGLKKCQPRFRMGIRSALPKMDNAAKHLLRQYQAGLKVQSAADPNGIASCVIGRASTGTYFHPCPSTSRKHLKIDFELGVFTIADLQSRCGTQVRIYPTPGDVIDFDSEINENTLQAITVETCPGLCPEKFSLDQYELQQKLDGLSQDECLTVLLDSSEEQLQLVKTPVGFSPSERGQTVLLQIHANNFRGRQAIMSIHEKVQAFDLNLGNFDGVAHPNSISTTSSDFDIYPAGVKESLIPIRWGYNPR